MSSNITLILVSSLLSFSINMAIAQDSEQTNNMKDNIMATSPSMTEEQRAEKRKHYFKEGLDYQYGLTKPMNRQKANQYFEQAAELGEMNAKFFLSLNFLAQGDRNKAFQYADQAVKSGSEIAKYALGEWWFAKDEKKSRQLKKEALKTMMQALEQGDLHYAVFIGDGYFYGANGMEIDLDKAIHYYALAAQQGNAKALEELGRIYLDDLNDIDRAEDYLLKAAEKNNAEAQYLLSDSVYTQKEDLKKIYYWAEKAAENHHIDAMLKLANAYVDKKEYDKAFYYVEKGVALNDENALIAMGELYEYGLGVPKDNQKALEYYKKSNAILPDSELKKKIKTLEATPNSKK